VASLKEVKRPGGKYFDVAAWTALAFDDFPLALRDVGTSKLRIRLAFTRTGLENYL
jgi:hypothetical protein